MFDRPDWTDAKAYRGIEGASLLRIAWEFLRRNPEYHKAWESYARRVRDSVAGGGDVARYAELILTANPAQALFDALGDAEALGELSGRLHDDFGFMAPVPGKPGRLEPLDWQYGREWGLDGMPHPSQSYWPPAVRFTNRGNAISSPTSFGLRELEEQQDKNRAGLFDTKWLVLRIDLSLPLEVIESTVMQAIRHEREYRVQEAYFKPVNRRALSKKRYAEYLRILDGAAAGLSASEIGAKLSPSANNEAGDSYPRDKRFRAALSEAQRLQTDGYKVLPLLEKSSSGKKK